MGCDIHICTEYRMKEKDKWRCCDYFEYVDNFDEGERLELVPIYDARDYRLFSILANVRNSYNIQPIDNPRGLPDDVSGHVAAEAEKWGVDGHSHSWLTARELFIYLNKHRHIINCGMVSPEDAKALDEKGLEPSEWCSWTSDNTWQYREWETANTGLGNLVNAVKKRMCEEFWIWEWERDKEDQLWEYADDFRIVFWFDN